ncbi:MAG: hypothetical protein CMC82_00350 [Flavobacteriaceae bacterium]|nr:hypothetical protein [Flavobacteriaceae bacterium]|tara:strand:+ start:799 stop:1518 length:720 start_codon:yes stop_codon:yes gene_type:complete
MKKVFIDAGANIGQSARSFLSEWPLADEFQIYCFEPSQGKNIRDSLKKLEQDFSNVKVFENAIWIKDETLTFYDEEKTSSSLIKEKLCGSGKETLVSGINLSKWIQNNFSQDDEIILKLDIEGTEYEVLEHMVNEFTIFMLDKIFIEIHGSKCGKTLQETKDLLDLISTTGHKLYEWEGETFVYKNYEDNFYTEEMIIDLYKNWSSRGFDSVIQQRKRNNYYHHATFNKDPSIIESRRA